MNSLYFVEFSEEFRFWLVIVLFMSKVVGLLCFLRFYLHLRLHLFLRLPLHAPILLI